MFSMLMIPDIYVHAVVEVCANHLSCYERLKMFIDITQPNSAVLFVCR